MDQQQTPLNDSQRLVVIETLVRESRDDHLDHEKRIRVLEKIVWVGMGLSAAAGSAVGSFIGQSGAQIGGG